jgi:hypothetical protein
MRQVDRCITLLDYKCRGRPGSCREHPGAFSCFALDAPPLPAGQQLLRISIVKRYVMHAPEAM